MAALILVIDAGDDVNIAVVVVLATKAQSQ